MQRILVATWFALAFLQSVDPKIEIGGRVPENLLASSQEELLLSAVEIPSRCEARKDPLPELLWGARARPNKNGFFRLPLPRAMLLKLTLATDSNQRQIILEPWFGPLRIPAEQFAVMTDVKGEPADSVQAPFTRIEELDHIETIDLLVVETESGLPISGAIVWRENQPGCYAITDEDGTARLRLPGARPSYQVRFLTRAALHAEGSFFLAPTERERVVPLKKAPATLAVQVVDSNGRPVQEAAIRIGHRRKASFTDEHGRFIYPGFAIGENVRVGINHDDFRSSRHLLEASASADSTPLTIVTLWRPRDLSGRVVDTLGRPLSGVSVSAGGESAETTGETGAFVVTSAAEKIEFLELDRQDLVAKTLRVELGTGETPLDVGDVVLKPALRLWGRTVDLDGKPIPEAEVVVGEPLLRGPSAGRRQEVHTDPRGEFVATGLPAGEDVEILVQAKGFQPTRAQLRLEGDEERNFVLRPASRLVGRIVDSLDFPLEGVRVSVQSSRTNLPARSVPHLRTDAEGLFIADDLVPGMVEVSTFAPGFSSHEETVGILEGEDAEIEIRLDPEGYIIGRLTDKTDAAVAHAHIQAVGRTIRIGMGDSTDTAGGFQLHGLRPGPLEVEVIAGTVRQRFETIVAPGEQRLELQLGDAETFSLEGYAILGDQPLAGAVVRLNEMMNGTQREMVTGPDGSFRFENLAVTAYALSFPRESGLVPSVESSRVTLRGDVKGWILDARMPCSLTGRVTGLTPRELGEMIVSVDRDGWDSKYVPVDHGAGTGSFSVPSLLPGRWTLQANAIERPLTATTFIVCEGRGEELTPVLDFDRTERDEQLSLDVEDLSE